MSSSRKRILFLTNSDYGLANVILATAHSIMHTTANVEIHIASFQDLEGAVAKTSSFALETAPPGSKPHPIVFHCIKGATWGTAAFRPEAGLMEAYEHPPGLINSAKVTLLVPAILLPWHPEEFVPIYKQTSEIFSAVKPDLTVVEPLFGPGLTLCNHLKTNWIVLAPNTIKDFALPAQPGLAMLWKYPFVGSGIPFPVPWSLLLRNIALAFVGGYALLTNRRIKEATSLLHEQVDSSIAILTANELGVLKAPPPGVRIIVSGTPALDYPFATIPPHVIPCGPILRAAPGIDSVDPDLASWLRQGPTVYVNLGTQLKVKPSEALEMALALRDMLDRAEAVGFGGPDRKIQVLWKMGRKAEPGEEIKPGDYSGPWKPTWDVLSSEIGVGRVRITDWLTPEPKTILMTGHVICSVNHGGASSFNEAICAGVPQVLLPLWADCYDFGNRVELLKVGRWANQKAKPRWKRDELGSCLDDVLFGPHFPEFLATAQDIASHYYESRGREKAAEEILKALN
ncbi:hypothetical protein BX600DRAFT_507255 [Xylariales sp. PMI_506]|nr:hypothetical protein BX600DRAFT_507255 [Xylariales sp. PMI_506]